MTAIEELRERDWADAISADGTLDPGAQVVEHAGRIEDTMKEVKTCGAQNLPRAFAFSHAET